MLTFLVDLFKIVREILCRKEIYVLEVKIMYPLYYIARQIWENIHMHVSFFSNYSIVDLKVCKCAYSWMRIGETLKTIIKINLIVV